MMGRRELRELFCTTSGLVSQLLSILLFVISHQTKSENALCIGEQDKLPPILSTRMLTDVNIQRAIQ